MLLLAYRAQNNTSDLSLLPNEHGGGVAFTNDETCRQSAWLAELYVRLIDEIAGEMSTTTGLAVHVCQPLVRRAVVPLTHAYFDRLLRLLRLRKMWDEIEVARTSAPPTAIHCDQLYALAASSFPYNQYLLSILAETFGIHLIDVDVHDPLGGKPRVPEGFINHLNLFPGSTIPVRLRRKTELALSPYYGRMVATWLSDTRVPSLDAGLYRWGRFAHMQDHWRFVEGKASEYLRKTIIGGAVPRAAAPIGVLLGRCGIAEPALVDNATRGLARLLSRMYPTTLLETAHENLEIGINELSRYARCKTVYSCGISVTTQAAILTGAARMAGKKIIGSQHGGHHGYIDQHTTAIEMEYADCDEYVTWGWENMPQHPATGNVRCVSLPAPWISHRTKLWRRALTDADRYRGDKPFDFAFLPNKVYYFPPGPSGAHATSNHLPEIARQMVELVTSISKAGWRLLFKPHGLETTYLLHDTLQKLQIAGGDNFKPNDNLDKGITLELVRNCRILLWDQPGTGFLECLAADIPTMVLWTRLFNREAPRAAAIFARLEDVGIVHRTVDSLIVAYRDFADAPAAWCSDAARLSVCRSFVREFGWVEDDWASPWKAFIKERSR